MKAIDFEEMQQMQVELREKYGKYWGGLDPKEGAHTLLWLIGEASEVGDILKKEGEDAVMENLETRRHFVEEMTDVMMYFNDLMICFDISPEELSKIYREKHTYNMSRW